MTFLPTPKTLREVAEFVAVHGGCYSGGMKEFIDNLVRESLIRIKRPPDGDDGLMAINTSMYRDEPSEATLSALSPVQRAHLSGMAEHLSTMADREPPAWCLRPEFVLAEPWVFGGPVAAETSIADTPPAFAKRQLFCGKVLMKLTAAISREVP